MNRFFCDMDGVLADYMGLARKHGHCPNAMASMTDVFNRLAPLPGALAGLRTVAALGWDVFIATKPPTRAPHGYADKVTWVLEHLPEFHKKLIMTQDKGLLGDAHDVLLDDRLHVANCHQFRGLKIEFDENYPEAQWAKVVELMKQRKLMAREAA